MKTYYVAPKGTASWANCRKDFPCNLNTANANVVKGDIIIIKKGEYIVPILPVNFGVVYQYEKSL